MAAPRRIVLIHKRAPGDTTVLTGLVRDIALSHPGQFEIDVDTSAMDLWRHNPYLTPLKNTKGKKGIEYIKIQYGRGIRDQNFETVHFLSYFHRDFERQCRIPVPVHFPYPDLHLSPDEQRTTPITGRYWVMISGGKSDFTAKVWKSAYMQEVADSLQATGLGVVQLGSTDPGHWHPPIEGAVNLVGQTNLRDALRLIHHADGVICGNTFAMHAAAALHRPCVVLGGGREAWYWAAYNNENTGFGPLANGKHPMPHRFLHTIGLLPCCQHHGCWRNKTVPLKDDKSLCLKPVIYPGQPVPLCMTMITPAHVMEAVMSYYTDQSLPPISVQPPIVQATPPVMLPAPLPPVPARSRRGLLDLFDDIPETATVTEPAMPLALPATAAKTNGNRVKTQAIVRMPPGIGLAPAVKLEGRPGAPMTAATQPGVAPTRNYNNAAVFDHADVGGSFTVFVLFYGPEKFFDLHKKCLDALVSTLPAGRFDLRVGSNELNPKSLAMIEDLVARGIVTKHYRHEHNDLKYPVMREMFFDPDCPIRTKWFIWFDDDSIADRAPDWLGILGQAIIQHHRKDNAHMFGAKMVSTLQRGQKEWFQSRPWYKGRPWRMQTGQPSPNGNKIIFCAGFWWAATHEAIVACDIPDAEIGHNGGDIVIGEQLWQGGFNTKAFNGQKQFIHSSSVPRRGVEMSMPGTTPAPKLIKMH